MVGESKIKIKHECVVYSIMGRPRIFYGNIKIIWYIVIIILIILFYIVWNSVTNLQYRLLNGMHDPPCSTSNDYTMFLDGGPCGMGGNKGLSPG